MSITIAAGDSWHIYEDQLDEKVWLEVEDIHENLELEITRPVGRRGRRVDVEVALPTALADLLQRLL